MTIVNIGGKAYRTIPLVIRKSTQDGKKRHSHDIKVGGKTYNCYHDSIQDLEACRARYAGK